MRVWYYFLGGFVVAAIIALIITANRDDGTTVAPQSSNTTSSTASGSYQSTLYSLSPASSMELLLQSSTLPEAAKAPLQQAESLYQQALQASAADAIPLLDQCVDNLKQAQSIVSDEAEDASNQVSQDNLKRMAGNIEVVRTRVEDDRALLDGTGTPIAAGIIERAGL
jgi:hypothetical protein